ncbi:MAG TPA: hypothetical protein VGC55_14545, partial [Dokdonella sp.]
LPDIEAYIEQKIPTAAITAELLITPPPRPRATPVAASDDDNDDVAADDARNTAGPPPKQGASAPRSRGPRPERSGERSSGERRSSGRRDANGAGPQGGAKPAAAVKPPAAPEPVEVISAEASPAAVVAGDGEVPRKRRRRGGRGRNRREGGEALNPATTAGSENGASTPAHASERKPRREHAPRSERTIAMAPPAQAEASAPLPPKQGFFRRIARLFNPR